MGRVDILKLPSRLYFQYLQSLFKMDYLGYNYYFASHQDHSDEEGPEIQDYLSVEALVDHQEMPHLDDYPFEQQKKLEETLEVTEEHDKIEELEPIREPEPKEEITYQRKVIDKYKEVYRGSKDDTVQLNINFKTLLSHYFRELKLLNELNQYEIKHVNEFNDRVPSFNSLMIFYENSQENQGIRERSLQLFSSQECMKRIMLGRSKMKTKLQMIKFIQKMRFNILTKGKGYKWKDSIKKEK